MVGRQAKGKKERETLPLSQCFICMSVGVVSMNISQKAQVKIERFYTLRLHVGGLLTQLLASLVSTENAREQPQHHLRNEQFCYKEERAQF